MVCTYYEVALKIIESDTVIGMQLKHMQAAGQVLCCAVTV